MSIVAKKKRVMKTVVSTVFSEGANGLALQGFSFALKLILKLPLLFFSL